MAQHVRIARPVADVARSKAMYVQGLGLHEIGSFQDHEGFDGVMLQGACEGFHFEFTHHRAGHLLPQPTPEDLTVFYIPDASEWAHRCTAMLQAGFAEVRPYNPYWAQKGRTFQDWDGYRVVIVQASWDP
jgi:catechol 2,3-dioxygenase-like lactoylglutathione lyase family enzyme